MPAAPAFFFAILAKNLFSIYAFTRYKAICGKELLLNMTFDTVLAAFADYLHRDADCEVVLTGKGYAVLGWDDGRENWETAEHCATPEALRDHLADAFTTFMALELTDGDRPLTEAEERQIEAARQDIISKCG